MDTVVAGFKLNAVLVEPKFAVGAVDIVLNDGKENAFEADVNEVIVGATLEKPPKGAEELPAPKGAEEELLVPKGAEELLVPKSEDPKGATDG